MENKRKEKVKSIYSILLLVASIIASVGGILAFIFLFLLDFNLYWLILSPVILALYQSPAVFLFWLWKKKYKKTIHSD